MAIEFQEEIKPKNESFEGLINHKWIKRGTSPLKNTLVSDDLVPIFDSEDDYRPKVVVRDLFGSGGGGASTIDYGTANSLATSISSLIKYQSVSIFNWIPVELHASIYARTCTEDLRPYIDNAFDDLLELADADGDLYIRLWFAGLFYISDCSVPYELLKHLIIDQTSATIKCHTSCTAENHWVHGWTNTHHVWSWWFKNCVDVRILGGVMDGNYNNVAANTFLMTCRANDSVGVVYEGTTFTHNKLHMSFLDNTQQCGFLNSKFIDNNYGDDVSGHIHDYDISAGASLSDCVVAASTGCYSWNARMYDRLQIKVTGVSPDTFGYRIQRWTGGWGNGMLSPNASGGASTIGSAVIAFADTSDPEIIVGAEISISNGFGGSHSGVYWYTITAIDQNVSITVSPSTFDGRTPGVATATSVESDITIAVGHWNTVHDHWTDTIPMSTSPTALTEVRNNAGMAAGLTIAFGATTGHTLNDVMECKWLEDRCAYPEMRVWGPDTADASYFGYRTGAAEFSDTMPNHQNFFIGNTIDNIAGDACDIWYQRAFTAYGNQIRRATAGGFYMCNNRGARSFGNTIDDVDENGFDTSDNIDLSIVDNDIRNVGGAGVVCLDWTGIVDGPARLRVTINRIKNCGRTVGYSHSSGIDVSMTSACGQDYGGVTLLGNDISDDQAVPTTTFGVGMWINSGNNDFGGQELNRVSANTVSRLNAYAAYDSGAEYWKSAAVGHSGVDYICITDNGPGTTAGVIEPGTDLACWYPISDYSPIADSFRREEADAFVFDSVNGRFGMGVDPLYRMHIERRNATTTETFEKMAVFELISEALTESAASNIGISSYATIQGSANYTNGAAAVGGETTAILKGSGTVAGAVGFRPWLYMLDTRELLYGSVLAPIVYLSAGNVMQNGSAVTIYPPSGPGTANGYTGVYSTLDHPFVAFNFSGTANGYLNGDLYLGSNLDVYGNVEASSYTQNGEALAFDHVIDVTSNVHTMTSADITNVCFTCAVNTDNTTIQTNVGQVPENFVFTIMNTTPGTGTVRYTTFNPYGDANVQDRTGAIVDYVVVAPRRSVTIRYADGIYQIIGVGPHSITDHSGISARDTFAVTKLVASDGSPDPCLSADAGGALTSTGDVTVGGYGYVNASIFANNDNTVASSWVGLAAGGTQGNRADWGAGSGYYQDLIICLTGGNDRATYYAHAGAGDVNFYGMAANGYVFSNSNGNSLHLDANCNAILGKTGLARNSTNGFAMIPSYSDAGGAPSGTPAVTDPNYSALFFNRYTNKAYIHNHDTDAWVVLN